MHTLPAFSANRLGDLRVCPAFKAALVRRQIARDAGAPCAIENLPARTEVRSDQLSVVAAGSMAFHAMADIGQILAVVYCVARRSRGDVLHRGAVIRREWDMVGRRFNHVMDWRLRAQVRNDGSKIRVRNVPIKAYRHRRPDNTTVWPYAIADRLSDLRVGPSANTRLRIRRDVGRYRAEWRFVEHTAASKIVGERALLIRVGSGVAVRAGHDAFHQVLATRQQ